MRYTRGDPTALSDWYNGPFHLAFPGFDEAQHEILAIERRDRLAGIYGRTKRDHCNQ